MAEDVRHPETTVEEAPTAGLVIARRVILGLGLLLLLGLVVLILYTFFGPNGRGRSQGGFGINETGGLDRLDGRPADAFTLELFSGGTVTLEQLEGQVVVLNFWASWCPPCRQEAPALNAAWRELRDDEVTMLGVDVWDERGDALAFIEDYDVPYPNGFDPNQSIAVSYGVRGILETFIIDREGRLVAKFIGPVVMRELVDLVRETLAADQA